MRPYNACVIVFLHGAGPFTGPLHVLGLDIRAAGSVLSSVLLMTLLPMAGKWGCANGFI